MAKTKVVAKKKPVKRISERQKAQKRFVLWLVVWLLTLPVITVVQAVVRFLVRAIGENSFTLAFETMINVFSLLAGLFWFVGWIVPLAFGIIWLSKKK